MYYLLFHGEVNHRKCIKMISFLYNSVSSYVAYLVIFKNAGKICSPDNAYVLNFPATTCQTNSTGNQSYRTAFSHDSTSTKANGKLTFTHFRLYAIRSGEEISHRLFRVDSFAAVFLEPLPSRFITGRNLRSLD